MVKGARAVAAEKTHDVSSRVGLIFIAVCAGVGLVLGTLIPFALDSVGLLRLGSADGHVEHLGLRGAVMFGFLASAIGFLTGIMLSINRSWYKIAVGFPSIFLGILGGRAATDLHVPFGGEINILALCVLPFSLTFACLTIRDRVWRKYQQPIHRPSSAKPSPGKPVVKTKPSGKAK